MTTEYEITFGFSVCLSLIFLVTLGCLSFKHVTHCWRPPIYILVEVTEIHWVVKFCNWSQVSYFYYFCLMPLGSLIFWYENWVQNNCSCHLEYMHNISCSQINFINDRGFSLTLHSIKSILYFLAVIAYEIYTRVISWICWIITFNIGIFIFNTTAFFFLTQYCIPVSTLSLFS